MLRLVETSALADVLEELGYPNQVLAPTIAPLTKQRRFVGPAACVEFAPLGDEPPLSRSSFHAIDELADSGVVVVMAGMGMPFGAVLGGLMVREFRRRGAVGVIVGEASVRDVAEFDELGFPVFASGISPVNAGKNLRIASLQQPVRLPGLQGTPVTVSPRDVIVADDDGVIVLPCAIAQDVMSATHRVSEIEVQIAAAISAGISRAEAMTKGNRFAHLSELKQRIGQR